MNNSDLSGIVPVVNPLSRVDLTAAASSSTTTQGQFATIDASTRILSATTASLALNVVLASSPFSQVVGVGAIDDKGLLVIAVDQGTNGQTVNSITLTAGTLVFQHVGTRYGLFYVIPDSEAKVRCTIALSAGNANSRVTLSSRTYNATNTISTV